MTSLDWLLPPLLGSILLCLLLVPLGYQVIARGVLFADLAIAQWASLGALAGRYLGWDPALAGAPVSSLGLALLAAGAVHWTLRLPGATREAAIGVLYVVGASLAVLVVSGDPHGAQVLHRAVSGDLLWAEWPVLSALSVLALLMALLSWRRRGWSAGAGFLPVFALAVTYSVALAGLYVVFATLIITPWVQGRLQGRGPALAMAAALAGHAGGLGLSVLADVPAGPAVVVTTLVAALAMWFPARRRA
ncbi:ABC transporter [Marinobacter lutaoensis]|uniref:ABC transporter n=1 Tax=Marinobacter lutaoensis TaxID=135739 RepID=A0A1V2DSS2_9GAMM|nr:ABC transporter [Marinobacter lutaoensis]ONF43361.1 ABC transporter [Marinobacter lutaoensis]